MKIFKGISLFLVRISSLNKTQIMKLIITVILALSLSAVFAQIPAGYYANATDKSGTTLQAALHQIIDNHTVISYSGLWTAFQSTDAKSNGKVWDIYSDQPGGTPAYEFTFGNNQCGNYSGEGDCYNREHSFPQSWFNDQSPMVSDLFQIYPTDGFVNGRRGNYPYGETSSPTWTSTNGSSLGPCSVAGYSGTVFEPIDAYKGDLARTYFYMATRYYGEDGNWPGSAMVDGAEPKAWAIAMLLQWSNNDPVSQKEIDRNNAIYGLQGNRNPFIDHPEYAGYIWGGETPDPGGNTGNGDNEDPADTGTTVQRPGNPVSDFSTSFITLNWTDATGSQLPTGYLIVYNAEGFQSLPTPTDGTAPESYPMAKVVDYGVGKCTIGNLQNNTKYYLKIYSYTGSGNTTDYKTNGTVPQLEQITH
jgi:endonuclease I